MMKTYSSVLRRKKNRKREKNNGRGRGFKKIQKTKHRRREGVSKEEVLITITTHFLSANDRL